MRAASVAVVGAGAIGSWLADALSHAGWRVSVLARGAALNALRAHGLGVETGGVWRHTHPQVGSAADLGIHDYVLLAVKAQHLTGLAPQLHPLMAPHTVVLSATNGIPWWFFQRFDGPLADCILRSVDPDGSQARAFSAFRCVGSVVHASVRLAAPGRAQVMAADRVIVGEPSGSNGERVATLIEGLRAGGINAIASEGIRQEVWAKLWGNMNMNPLSALTRSSTGALLADPAVCGLSLAMMEEMEACGRYLGLPMAMSAAQRLSITRRLGDFKTSMWSDGEAGRELEYAPQIGAVVEIAERLALPAPFCRSVLGLIRLLSAAGRQAR